MSVTEVINAIKELSPIELHQVKDAVDEILKKSHQFVSYESIESSQRWLSEHGHKFSGQWVALDGDRLIANGNNAKAVYSEAQLAGVQIPFLAHVSEKEDLPFGGW
jgi:hypothetical protein